MVRESGKERRRTVRTAVDAFLLYRAVGMADYDLCHAVSASTLSLEILLNRSLPESTVITVMVRQEGSAQRHYRVVGEVLRVEQRESGWMHVVITSSRRPWSPMFVYDVLYSTCYPALGKPTRTHVWPEVVEPGANLKERGASPGAWRASVLGSRAERARANNSGQV